MPEFRPNRGQEIYIIQNVQSDQSHNYQVTFTAEKLKEKKPKISDITIALVYAIKVHVQSVLVYPWFNYKNKERNDKNIP